MEFELEIDPNYTSDEYDSQLSASDQKNSSSDEEVDDAEHDFPVLDGLLRKVEENKASEAHVPPFTEDTGPNHNLAHTANAAEYLGLFWDDDLFDNLVTETNRYDSF